MTIYFRIGRPKHYKDPKKPMGPIKLFLIKWFIILITLFIIGRWILNKIW